MLSDGERDNGTRERGGDFFLVSEGEKKSGVRPLQLRGSVGELAKRALTVGSSTRAAPTRE